MGVRKILTGLYDNLNRVFYSGTLPPVYIRFTFAEQNVNYYLKYMKNNQFCILINWKMLDCEEKDLYINILHQMAHIRNAVNDIKDTSRNYRYHNKNWNDEVKKTGVITDHNSQVGYYTVGIEEQTVNIIRSFFDFKKYKDIVATSEDAGSKVYVTYKCPRCNRLIRAVPAVGNIVICGYDHCKFVRID